MIQRIEAQKNVLGLSLQPCSFKPLTGYSRSGCCESMGSDGGRHWVCAVMTDAFLQFSREQGNDLSTPRPEYDFPGLVSGDHWCLCALRWLEAWQNGHAPRVVLQATHEDTLQLVSLDILEQWAWSPPEES